MAVTYAVTPELRLKFKEPLGTLIQGSFSETMNKLEEILKKDKPSKIISVGDIVSENLHQHQIIPQLSITDNKSMRKAIKPLSFPSKSLVKVKNPQGTITEEAILAIQDALKVDSQIHLLVDGEEDLLTLIAVLYAPENALVIYGQPREGIVIVKATPEKKADIKRILKAMETA
jgi:hypothetical protein